MQNNKQRALKEVAALLADVFPYIRLKQVAGKTDCFAGSVGRFFNIEVSPLLETNGHAIEVCFFNSMESAPVAVFRSPENRIGKHLKTG